MPRVCTQLCCYCDQVKLGLGYQHQPRELLPPVLAICWSEPSEKAAYTPNASASLLGPASGKGVKLGKAWKEGPVGLLIIAMENPTIVAIVGVRQPHACVKVMHSHIYVRVRQPRAHTRAVLGAGCNENRLGMGEGHHTHNRSVRNGVRLNGEVICLCALLSAHIIPQWMWLLV